MVHLLSDIVQLNAVLNGLIVPHDKAEKSRKQHPPAAQCAVGHACATACTVLLPWLTNLVQLLAAWSFDLRLVNDQDACAAAAAT